VCQKQFSTSKEVQQHMRSCVNTGQKLKVMVQRLTEKQLLALNYPRSNEPLESAATMSPVHISSTEESKKHRNPNHQISCNICSKRFNSKSTFNQHMQRHPLLRLQACDVPGCKYSTKVPHNLYMHKRRTHTSILYTCLLCGKYFKNH
jgi:hypothetical protein